MTKRKSEKLHPVFVYGSLKRGFFNSHILEGAELVAEALSCDRFAMWGDLFPYLAPKSRGHRVAGEIYLVDQATLARLDVLEGVPHHYRRTWRLFKVGRTRRRAWVYLTAHPSDYEMQHDVVRPGRDGVLRWEQREPDWPTENAGRAFAAAWKNK